MPPSKSQIREEIRRRQAQYDLADNQRASMRISSALEILMLQYFQPNLVMSYVSMHDEVSTHEIIRSCLRRGVRVCVPCVDAANQSMTASELENFSTDLEKGYGGIMEPRQDCRRPVDAEQIDLHLIPGVAFDPRGNRIGRGKGYYDRFLLEANPESIKVGLAYSWQVVDEIPEESHDVAMDLVVTEQGVVQIRDGLLE